MAVFVALLFLLLASPAVYAVDHVVGGSSGWSLSGDYTTWAAGETFTVGDKLIFNYDSSHGVAQLSQADYNGCSTGNALKSYSGGTTTITLNQAGPLYFACPTFGHCGSGMKLAITVQAAGGSGSSPSTPSGSPGTPSTSTPNPTPKTNAAAGSFDRINLLTLGFSGVLTVVLFAFKG